MGRPGTHFHVLESSADPKAGTLRVNAIWGLPGILAERGLDTREVLESAGLSPALLDDRDNLITYPGLERLFLECEKRLDCEHFGLLVGQRSRLSDMGLAGRIALCGQTAGEGLESFVDHFNLHDSAAIVSVIASGRFARFIYAISEHGMRDTRHFQLGGITIAFNILQDLCGRDWIPAEVHFACRSPSNLRPLHRFFRAPLRFDSEESALVFESHWLAIRRPPVESTLRQQLVTEIDTREAAIRADLPSSVRRLLRKQFSLGRSSMADVAHVLSMHRRTLDRRLRSHGTSYAEVLESVKYDVACQLLLDTDLQVNKIAESLHYSSAANFATAFRRWSGMTPSEFRTRAT